MRLLVSLKELIENFVIFLSIIWLILGGLTYTIVVSFIDIPAKYVLPGAIVTVAIFEIAGWGATIMIVIGGLNLVF